MQVGNETYDILVKREGETGYSAFCPQLELIVRGTAHQQVEEKMRQLILEHTAKKQSGEAAKAETATEN
jgi:hypothetical protein